jgi:hypothetical protein
VDTSELIKQHAEMTEEMGVIRGLLALPISSSLASNIGQRLDVLAASLGLHLSLEDRDFYPASLLSSDENLRTMAERFFVEMGHLRRAFGNYRESWKSDKAIQERFRLFTDDTQRVFALIEKRVRLEEEQLYPLWAASTLSSPETSAGPTKVNQDPEVPYFHVINTHRYRMKA